MHINDMIFLEGCVRNQYFGKQQSQYIAGHGIQIDRMYRNFIEYVMHRWEFYHLQPEGDSSCFALLLSSLLGYVSLSGLLPDIAGHTFWECRQRAKVHRLHQGELLS